MPTVLIAADKFKGSLTAVRSPRPSAGLRAGGQTGSVDSLPVADGGDGTVAAAVAAGFERPGGAGHRAAGAARHRAAFALRDGTAVVEMAEASGLQHLPAASSRR